MIDRQMCGEHSGQCEKIHYLEKELIEIKSTMDNFKGYVDGRFNSTNSEMKDLRKELTDKMESGFKEIKTIIENKETVKDNKKWILISSLVSPLIVGFILLIAQYLLMQSK